MKKTIIFIFFIFNGLYSFSQGEIQLGYGQSYIKSVKFVANNFSCTYNLFLKKKIGFNIFAAELYGVENNYQLYSDKALSKRAPDMKISGHTLELNFLLAPFGTQNVAALVLGVGPSYAYFKEVDYSYVNTSQTPSEGQVVAYNYLHLLFLATPQINSYFTLGNDFFVDFRYNISHHWNFSVQFKIQYYSRNSEASVIAKFGYAF